MNRTAESGEIIIAKLNNTMFISANASSLEAYVDVESSLDKRNNIIEGERSRILININHISHIENYKGSIRLIMQNGMCYKDDGNELERILYDYGLGMKGN